MSVVSLTPTPRGTDVIVGGEAPLGTGQTLCIGQVRRVLSQPAAWDACNCPLGSGLRLGDAEVQLLRMAATAALPDGPCRAAVPAPRGTPVWRRELGIHRKEIVVLFRGAQVRVPGVQFFSRMPNSSRITWV